MSRAEMQDPAQLRQFIATLQGYNDELSNRVSNLKGHWSELGGVWRDAKYQQFASEWEETVRLIENFLTEAPGYVSHLQTKLAQVEKYGE